MQDGKGQHLRLGITYEHLLRSVRSLRELKLDFVFGRNEEVRLCYWLCCQFPRDFNIPVEVLAMYSMCLDLFKDVHSLFEARDRVYTIIGELKRDNFLLDSEEDDYGNKCVKMVYDVPDFMVPIISKFNLETIQETVIKTWLGTESYKGCIGISLELKEISEFPVELGCPQLRLLQLKCRKQVPFVIFEGMKELRILSLDVPSVLPQSFTMLKQLRALYVKVFKWDDMSELGCLKHLEILSVSTIRSTDIPKEMGLMCNLRLLDLRKMRIARLPQGILSRMFKLEELYLPLSFSQWGSRAKIEHDYDDHWESGEECDYDNDGENINATLGDIGSLPLTTLQVTVPDASCLPLESSIFRKLTRFKILVKSNLRYRPFGKGSMNELQLRGDICDIEASRVSDLLCITEELCLIKVRNLRNVTDQLKGDDYPYLRKIMITECDDLESVFDITLPSLGRFSNLETLHLSMLCNLKGIWHRKWKALSWLANLKEINIRFCHKLKYVFPLSISDSEGWEQLQSVEIHHCNEMEGVFWCDKVDDETLYVYFPAELHLYSLPKLVGLLVEKDSTLNGNVASSSKRMEKRWGRLKKLRIAFCEALKVIFSLGEYHATKELEELELYGLQSLIHIWSKVPPKEITALQLRVLVLSRCHNLYVISSSVARLLVNLQKMQVIRCEKMTEIVSKDDDSKIQFLEKKILFPQLKVLELNCMPNLRTFYGGMSTVVFPSLEILKVNQCNRMQNFSYRYPEIPHSVEIQINDGRYFGNAAMEAMGFYSTNRQMFSKMLSTLFPERR